MIFIKYTGKILTAFFLLVLCTVKNTSAQQNETAYNLSNFKYRINGYRALVFAGDFSSGGENSITKDTVKENYLSNGLSREARYIQTISTDKKQRFTSIFGYINPYAQRADKYNATKTSSDNSMLAVNWLDFNQQFYEL